MNGLSLKNQQVLDILRLAVAHVLDRKRRLGQYAVIWKDDRAVRVEPGDIEPPSPEHTPGA